VRSQREWLPTHIHGVATCFGPQSEDMVWLLVRHPKSRSSRCGWPTGSNACGCPSTPSCMQQVPGMQGQQLCSEGVTASQAGMTPSSLTSMQPNLGDAGTRASRKLGAYQQQPSGAPFPGSPCVPQTFVAISCADTHTATKQSRGEGAGPLAAQLGVAQGSQYAQQPLCAGICFRALHCEERAC
jgi:hypothetical protein